MTTTKNSLRTIVAIATAPGQSGVGIVRLSGPDCLALVDQCFKAHWPQNWRSHHMVLGAVFNPVDHVVVDQGLAVWFQGPHSYTGEDVVEFHLHGNPLLLQGTVDLLCQLGAELAQPGEFTRRAYVNGRLDLVQAEAVAELITAESMWEITQAQQRLSGQVSHHLQNLYDQLVDVLATCEAEIDFPDEGVALPNQASWLQALVEINDQAQRLLEDFVAQGQARKGFEVVLVGRPNVGKSSVFNALLAQERALVTPIAGTTRDILREPLQLGRHRVHLLDSAGLRDVVDDEPADSDQHRIEQMGMAQTRQHMKQAQVVLMVISAVDSKDVSWELSCLDQCRDKSVLVVWNKVDCAQPPAKSVAHVERMQRQSRQTHRVCVSATTGQGIAQLRQALASLIDGLVVTAVQGSLGSERQQQSMQQFSLYITAAHQKVMRGMAPEWVASELRDALFYLALIMGRDNPDEDVLDRVFSRFCIGK